MWTPITAVDSGPLLASVCSDRQVRLWQLPVLDSEPQSSRADENCEDRQSKEDGSKGKDTQPSNHKMHVLHPTKTLPQPDWSLLSITAPHGLLAMAGMWNVGAEVECNLVVVANTANRPMQSITAREGGAGSQEAAAADTAGPSCADTGPEARRAESEAAGGGLAEHDSQLIALLNHANRRKQKVGGIFDGGRNKRRRGQQLPTEVGWEAILRGEDWMPSV